MTDTLEPCPFCDGQGELIFRPTKIRRATQTAHVFCRQCGAAGPVKSNKTDAIAAWNRRTP
jgi:Lar family restriction alleviation protein